MLKNKTPKQILLLCFCTYMAAYILRTNFSGAIPAISQQMNLSSDRLGIVGSVFFLSYAFGQLLNGVLADRLSPYRFVTFALVGTVAANVLLALGNNIFWIAVCWGINGYMQSIFWGTMTRILSFYFRKEQHSTVATVMSSSMVGGFVFSWTIIGGLIRDSSWQLFFFLPAVIGVLLLPLWAKLAVDSKNLVVQAPVTEPAVHPSLRLILEKRLWLICLICFALGITKESVSLWGPTIITSMLSIPAQFSFLLLSLIPAGNLCGMFLTKLLLDRFGGREIRTLVVLFVSIGIGALLLFFLQGSIPLLTVAIIVEISAMSYGCNSVLLSFIPLAYTRYNMVSTLVGIFDCSSYLGASLSSVVMGTMLAGSGLQRVPLLWMGAAALALSFCVAAAKKTELL